MPSAAVSLQDEAPVLVFNRRVMAFRAPFLGMPPHDRAKRAVYNIEQALDQGGPGLVTVKDAPQGKLIFVDGLMAIILAPVDVDPLSGDTLDALTNRAVQALRLSIRESQESRDTHHLLVNLAVVGAATLAAVALYFAAGFVRARMMAALMRFVTRKTAALGAGAAQVLRLDRMLAVFQKVDLLLSWALGLLFAYTWLSFSLLRFPYTRPWGEGLNAYLVSLVEQLFGALVGAVGMVGALFTRIELRGAGGRWPDPDLLEHAAQRRVCAHRRARRHRGQHRGLQHLHPHRPG